MAVAALRPCRRIGCRTVTRDGYCPAHAAKPWTQPAPPPRMRGRKLQQARAALFATEPLCRLCRADGRARAATIRDHVVPLAEGGEDSQANVQPICDACHEAKTARESRRGRVRARVGG